MPTPPLTGLSATNGGLPKQLKDAIHHGLAHRGLIETCRYGSGSRVAARPAFGDSGKGLGDALLGHAEPAGDLGLRTAKASQRHDQLVALHGAQAI